MLTIRRLVDRLYPRPENGYKIPLLGMEASGKTTLLYRLKLGEIVVTNGFTVPTMGFNVETIQVRVLGKSRRLVNMMCWDVGGCRKLEPPFMTPYTYGSDAFVWLVDSSARDRLAESVEELAYHIRILEDSNLNNSDRKHIRVPVLMQQDLPNPMSIDEIRTKFAKATSGTPTHIIGTTLKQSLTEGAFPEAFGWLLAAIEDIRAGKSLPPTLAAATPDPRSTAALETKLESWLLRAESDSSPEEFLRQFETINLPAWDHYAHIRITYLLLTTYGRQKGKNMIFDGIEKYIAQSEQTRSQTFHVTMTYFWIQIVHFGIRSMAPVPALDSASTSDKSSMRTLVEDDAKPGDDFARFLPLNPVVADGSLWADYYSKEVIMSPEGKAGMVFPDKKPLPNLVVRETISSLKSGAK
ncbi:ADP-ribosylation factor family-domain-containing protein [Mycena epipterygia]|nr:ADP-ribosylation factor family-domain-containing protein [Mycena epipterygia]